MLNEERIKDNIRCKWRGVNDAMQTLWAMAGARGGTITQEQIENIWRTEQSGQEQQEKIWATYNDQRQGEIEMTDVIVKDNKIYGFQVDLGKYIKECMDTYAQDKNWEEVKEMADLLLDLNAWVDNENMLVINDNNGMGYTIYEYKKGE